LSVNEGIEISYTTLINILKEAGFTSKKRHKPGRRGFRWRKRREHFGELLQIGATLYDWFGDGTPCVLHIIIDDATGRITGLYLCQSECLDRYQAVLRQTLTDYGIPMEIYSAMPGLFFEKEKNGSNHTEKKTQAKTNFCKLAEQKLGIEISCLDPVQGRKCHEALCDILYDNFSAWLKSQGITGIEQANKQMYRYINVFNSKFSVREKSYESLFVQISADLIYSCC